MKKLWILLAAGCCSLPATAQHVPQKKAVKADSLSANIKPVTTPEGEPLTDTTSGYRKWEENKTDSSKFRPLRQPVKK